MGRPRSFRGPADFRAWLLENHATETELLVRCCKRPAADRGLTYRQALDEALCFGWIDGLRRSVDEATFSVRFTPRTARSRWSAVNVARMGQLLAEGRAHPDAWRFYAAQPPWYRRTTGFWVMSAKKPETRARRLDTLIASCARETAIPLLARPGPPGKRES